MPPLRSVRRFIPRASSLFRGSVVTNSALLWMAVFFSGAFVFVELADEVVKGQTPSIDKAFCSHCAMPLITAIRSVPGWVEKPVKVEHD